MICLPTRITGFNAVRGSWKIIAIFAPRMSRSSFGLRPTSSSPRNFTEPVTSAVFGRSPSTASIVTDFPEPDSPTMPSTSPASRSRSKPRTAYTGPSSVLKVTLRSRISSTRLTERGVRVAFTRRRERVGHRRVDHQTESCFGSSASRRPSPTKFTHSTVSTSAMPGPNVKAGSSWIWPCACDNRLPHVGVKTGSTP